MRLRCVLLILTALWAWHAQAARPLDDEAFERAGFDPQPGQVIPPDLRLKDSRGNQVAMRELMRERPAVLALAYHDCPNLCGVAIGGLLAALQQLTLRPGRDFEVLVVSFDPREGPAQARTARRKALRRLDGDAAGWHFLTGDAAALVRLTDAVGFRYAYDEALEQYAHAAGLVLLTPGGKISRYLYGVSYEPRDLRLGLLEAGRGDIGTLSDQVLLLCYRYDPTTGRYSNLAMGMVRGGGVILLLGLTGYLGRALVRERREDAG